jgi:RNase P protein component
MVQLKSKAASDELAMLISGSPKNSSSQTNMATTMQSKSHSDSVRARAGADAAAGAGHVGDRRRAAHTVPMSLMVVTPKKALHKSGVVRTRIKRRLKEALSLVAIRGAGPREDDDGLKAKDEDKDGRIAFRTLEGLQRDDIEASGILQGKR